MALLEVDGLVVRFGGLTALDGIDLAVEAHELVSVIGPNGAGKTTLFNVIAGAQPLTRGEVRFAGRSTRGYGATRMSYLGVARTFQVARPFRSLSVRDNVRLGAAGRTTFASARTLGPRRRAVDASRKVDELLSLIGLDGKADEKAGRLNIGELRRLELGRALAADPRLLLLDEPAAGIGADGMRPLAQLIKGCRERGLTILLVEHHVGFALSLGDRAVVLDAGRVISAGSPDAVRSDPVVVNAYLGRSGPRVEAAGGSGDAGSADDGVDAGGQP
ncbi:MAG: ABC transporter ATP-binding protein [Candidatus Limnocylindrales bacterium]